MTLCWLCIKRREASQFVIVSSHLEGNVFAKFRVQNFMCLRDVSVELEDPDSETYLNLIDRNDEMMFVTATVLFGRETITDFPGA